MANRVVVKKMYRYVSMSQAEMEARLKAAGFHSTLAKFIPTNRGQGITCLIDMFETDKQGMFVCRVAGPNAYTTMDDFRIRSLLLSIGVIEEDKPGIDVKSNGKDGIQ
jgi:hypothetical protein